MGGTVYLLREYIQKTVTFFSEFSWILIQIYFNMRELEKFVYLILKSSTCKLIGREQIA